jgi:hypothetical protein
LVDGGSGSAVSIPGGMTGATGGVAGLTLIATDTDPGALFD